LPSKGYVSQVKVLKAGDTLEQRGLSAARRPEQADEFVAADMQRDIVERFPPRASDTSLLQI